MFCTATHYQLLWPFSLPVQYNAQKSCLITSPLLLTVVLQLHGKDFFPCVSSAYWDTEETSWGRGGVSETTFEKALQIHTANTLPAATFFFLEFSETLTVLVTEL